MSNEPQQQSILRMAIASPIAKLFDYLPSEDTQLETLTPGMRFELTFGNRKTIGFFIEKTNHSELSPEQLKQVERQIDTHTSCFSPTMLKMIQWMSQYYHCSLGMGLMQAVPKPVRSGDSIDSSALERTPSWQLSTLGKGLSADSLKGAKKQAALIELLSINGTQDEPSIKQAGFSKSIINALADKQLIEHSTADLSAAYHENLNNETLLNQPPLSFTPEQQQTYDAIVEQLGFSCHLINGVTGSGKTEIYLQLIHNTLKQGKQALILIPEIALTPQTVSRFEQRFSVPITVMHSQLSDKKRYQHWLACKYDQASIVIGTRSAIFAPLNHLGIVIVDEEHDNSYKQFSQPLYNARDMAIYRAQQLKIPVILGSATPSIESLHNAMQQRYQMHRLLQRSNKAQKPSMQLVDTNHQALEEGLSIEALRAIEDCINKQQQVIVFINRRGFSPVLLCSDCGWMAQCPHCDAKMIYHKRKNLLRCHHCEYQQGVPSTCPSCHSQQLQPIGMGTQRTEDFLNERFSNTPVIRIDRDSVQSKKQLETKLDELEKTDAAILIGTQMLAKGHHFPNVTLVVVLESDSWLFANDFRNTERLAQLMTQVAGRTGRGDKAGQALIQTRLSEHPFWMDFFSKDYTQIAQGIVAERAQTLMPPHSYLCLLRAEHPNAQQCIQLLQHIKQWLGSFFPDIHCIGPLPSNLSRKAGRYRYQLQIKSSQRQSLHQALGSLEQHLNDYSPAKRINWTMDIDPQEMG